ncbi:MAG TPA: amino acid ABC transporter permease [Anaerolineae bacterium]|nr:amino acid ABC transporter permease [Anaerolineae bacterium]HXV96841.1 amino acid ABC transporter permease [Anaerolineae bacterium]
MAERALSQTQLVLLQQQRARYWSGVQVVIWWVIILAVVVFAFSGIEFNLGPISINTITLDTEFIATWAPYISQGVPQTLWISAVSIVCASILALASALARLSGIPPLVALASFYVSLIRGTPLYLQIFFFFLALPQIGIKMPPAMAGVLALSLNYGAYMSEIFRAGISSVGRGQREAAIALGMTQSQLMRRIVLPQALRLVVPPTGNEFIAMLKDSALVSATGFVQEIMWRAQKVGRANFRGLEALLVAALWYWLMTIIFSTIQANIEKRMSRGDR